MSRVVILDTGPLVAWANRSDQWHAWSANQFQRLTPPLVTCEAVLAEAAFLIARSGGDPAALLAHVEAGHLQCEFRLQSEAAAVGVLMRRYADTPMSLADACLVRLSELQRDCRVLTLDRDFAHYRRFGRSLIPLLSPWVEK